MTKTNEKHGDHWSKTVFTWIQRLIGWHPTDDLSGEERSELQNRLLELRQTILQQRAPRIAVVGSSEVELPKLVETITGVPTSEDDSVHTYLGRARWYDWNFPAGQLQLLDLRRQPDDPFQPAALERQAPDIVLFPWVVTDDSEDDHQFDDLEELYARLRSTRTDLPTVVTGLVPSSLPDSTDRAEARHRLRQRFRNSSVPEGDLLFAALDHPEELTADLLASAPPEAKLRLARVAGSPATRKRIAQRIIRSSAGVAAALASMPLPVADFVPITAVQLLMVATVAHVAGRRLRLQTVGEFLTAAGVNVGAGYAFREVFRALVQLVPFAGAVVSSGIAAGATYAIGNAAVRYFIGDADSFDAAPERVKRPGWERTADQ